MYSIGYDLKDAYVSFKGLRIAIRLSTTGNLYTPLKDNINIEKDENGIRLISEGLSLAGGQKKSDGYLELNVYEDKNGHCVIGGKGSHPTEECKSIVILIKGINIKSLDYDSVNMDNLQFTKKKGIGPISYPGRTPMMPLVFINTSAQGEWFILSKDEKVRRKSFGAFYDYISEEPTIIISHEEDRRFWGLKINLPEWHIGKAISRLDIVKERCADLEKNYGLMTFNNNRQSKLIQDIKLVVNFHGEHWTGYCYNTFDGMLNKLRWVCEQIDGKHVLAFLPAWDGRYYYCYPEHRPSPSMGGEEGLKSFIDGAHELGVKVVLMLGGPNLATFDFLKEHDMEDAALKNEWGYPILQDWVDWNSDLSKECQGFVVNFGHPEFRQYMVESSCNLIQKYNVDGIFLDGAIRWENDPYYSPYEGMVEWVRQMNERYPECILMAEDGYDVLWGLFPLFATADGPLGLENAFLRYSRQTYYLAYPAENGSGGIHERAWYWNGQDNGMPKYTIPTISLIDDMIDKYSAQIQKQIAQYKDWKLGQSPIIEDK